MLPNTKFIWSQIVPRYNWRYSKNSKAMNCAAVRLNNYAASLIVGLSGKYIKYPEISWDNRGMFGKDGVHLSQLGNSFFLYNLQSTLSEITMQYQFVFLSSYGHGMLCRYRCCGGGLIQCPILNQRTCIRPCGDNSDTTSTLIQVFL